MNWYLDPITKKYFMLNGRAGRQEFWMFILCNFIVALAVYVVSMIIRVPVLYYLYVLAIFLPGLGLAVRRLHDTGRSGWWYLIGLVPLIGFIVLIIFFIQDSQPGDNQYGPNPKTTSPSIAPSM